jgi:hypothetical protein
MATINTLKNAYVIGQNNFDSWSQGFDANGYLKVLPHPDEKITYKDPFLQWQQDHQNYKSGVFVSEGANGTYYSSWGPDEVLDVTLNMDELEQIVVDGFGIVKQGDGFIDWLGKATPYDILRAYNGQINGPMLITEPGDTIKITLNNNLDQITNLHTHGLHVSPVGNGDNVLITVPPGDSWDVEIKIPEDHFIGPDWYHPHFHGETNEQVASGLGGYLLVNPPYDLPDLEKFDPVTNPAFFMAIKSFGIQQEYRPSSPTDPLNQFFTPPGFSLPAGTPLDGRNTLPINAQYQLLNGGEEFGPDFARADVFGTDENAPFDLTTLTGSTYLLRNTVTGEFITNTDPTLLGKTNPPFGIQSFVISSDNGIDKLFGTESAEGIVYPNFTVSNEGTITITGGEGIFAGATGELSFIERGNFTQTGYVGTLDVSGEITLQQQIYSLSESPFVGYNAKPLGYNPKNPQGFPVPGPDFSSAYGEGALGEPVENVIHTVNGQYNPTIETSTGAWNLFSFANMTVNSFHVIQLLKEEIDGTLTPQEMLLTAIDGDAAGVVEEIRREVTVSPILNPGSRISLQNWFEEPGKYYFLANATDEVLGEDAPAITEDQGFKDGHLIWGSQVLATIDVTGDPTPTGDFPEPYDVLVKQSNEINQLVDTALNEGVTQERNFVWSANIGGALSEGRLPDDTEVSTFEGTYRINGEYFATEGGGMPPLTMPMLGSTEIWNLQNISGVSDEKLQELGIDLPLLEWHPFHIHQNDFVVLEINGIPVEQIDDNYLARVLSDTIALPPSYAPGSVTPENPYGTPQINGTPSEVKILMEFADYPGAYVNHCHILFHEDAGMMAVVRVILNTEDTWLSLSTDNGNFIRLFTASNTNQNVRLNAYNFSDGVDVAIADVNYKNNLGAGNTNVTDNVTDVVTIQKQLTSLDQQFTVKVFDGESMFQQTEAGASILQGDDSNLLLAEIRPFANITPTLDQTASIASGDVNGDGFAEIVAAIAGGVAPLIEIYSGQNYELIASIAPFHHEDNFNGEINIAVGDLNGDNFGDILISQGNGGRGLVEAYDGKMLDGLITSGQIRNLSAIGVAHDTSMFAEAFQPYGDSYTGEIEITSGYNLQTPETPNDSPIQTSAANITTVAIGDLPAGQEPVKIHSFFGGGHHSSSDHSGDNAEGAPEIRLDKEFTPSGNIEEIAGTFADINGDRGQGVLFTRDGQGNNKLIHLQEQNIPEEITVESPVTDLFDSPFYRFQNKDIPSTYLYAGEQEAQNIRQNFPNFQGEGFAFNASVTPNDELISLYRFQNMNLPGTYLYVGEQERQSVLANFPNFTEEGLAFYAFGADENKGQDIYRFQNINLPGTYLYVGEQERQSVLANFPNFVEEGIAFEVLT